jgi:hypothetical protein
MSKFKKTILVVISGMAVLIAILIICISPLAKYLIQKYDMEYTGREITISRAYVNPFTGYIHLKGLKIFEQNSTNIFFSAKGLSADFALFKMFFKTYEISALKLDSPMGVIIQNRAQLNINDLIEKFSADPDTIKEAVHFNILDITVENGVVVYLDKAIPVNYSIKSINIQSPGLRWNLDTIAATFSFSSNIGRGDVKGEIGLNKNTLDYNLEIQADKYELDFIGQYLKDLTNYGSFSANLDAAIKVAGNFNNSQNIIASGFLGLNDFHFGKTPDNDYASFGQLAISIVEINSAKHIYFYDSIVLQSPYFKFERYDYLDNIQRMFGVKGANIGATVADEEKFNLVIEIANYIKLISRNFFQSQYKVNSLAVYNGDIKFEDYSLSEKFSVGLNPLTIISDSIDTNTKRVNVLVKSGIKPFGGIYGNLSINPKDSGDFDLKYILHKLPLALFNPYAIAYTSFPLNRGTIEANGNWHVRDGIIESDNHLLISNLRTGKRLKNKGTRYVPVPLAMAFVRDAGNIIDYDIPITGDLKNPKFKLHDVIWDLIENIFVKPPTTPYRMRVKNIVSEIEDSFMFSWQMRKTTHSNSQQKFIKKLVEFLAENPQEGIVVHPQWHTEREKEYILFFEAKKKYFLFANNRKELPFNKQDSILVERMSVKDSLFICYLNLKVNDAMLFTVHEKCSRLISHTLVNAKFEQLNKQREEAFIAYFKEKEVEKQVKFTAGKNMLPYNGFSNYKLEYKGEFPESLKKAYRQMNEINDKWSFEN